MQDLLVPLYKLAEPHLGGPEVEVRPVFPAELTQATEWVRTTFGDGWASEFEYAAKLSPVSAYLAIEGNKILGFACNHAAAKGVFGPTGVHETARGQGVGKRLLFRALWDLRAQGYAYAIIGGVGPVDYYKRVIGAVEIAGGSDSFLNTLLSK